MATLADSFLADFESDDEEQKELHEGEEKEEADLPEPTVTELDFDAEDADMKDAKGESVTAVTTALNDTALQSHLERIRGLMAASEDENGVHRNVDREAEYPVIVKSNEMTVMIDNEIATVHKFIRDIYATRFPELEQMVPMPLDYAKVVKVIGNHSDLTLVEKELADIIPQQTILTITVTATSSSGKPLSEEDLQRAVDACDSILRLEECKKEIFSYIESRMTFIAPNLSAIVGPDIAARLVGTAGGLTALAKIPACNLQVLGQQRKAVIGLSAARQDLHMGLLAQTDIILRCPPALRHKALRLLAGKCALVARMDSVNEDTEGDTGHEFREDIEAKIEKWQEPPPPKKKRPLPVPADKPRKKRGGRKYRKLKELLQQTELMKQKNRVLFGQAQHVDEYTGVEYGMIGQAGAGALSVRPKDTQKLKNKISKKTQARMNRIKTSSGTATAIAGTASSIAFTPVQGIELVNPDLQQKRLGAAGDKYFSSTGSFFRVGKGGTASLAEPGAGSSSSSSSSSSNTRMAPRSLPAVPAFSAPSSSSSSASSSKGAGAS